MDYPGPQQDLAFWADLTTYDANAYIICSPYVDIRGQMDTQGAVASGERPVGPGGACDY